MRLFPTPVKNLVIAALTAIVAALGLAFIWQHASKITPSGLVAATSGKSGEAQGAAPRLSARVPPGDALALCRTLLDATIRGDYAVFKRQCETRGDANMRSVASAPDTEMTFRKAARVLAKPCWSGYDLQYLGELSQSGGHQIFLWKLAPSAGRDEFLIRLTLRDGQLAGFFFQ